MHALTVLLLCTAHVLHLHGEAFIEEVNDRQLEKLVEENDFVAVAWFTKTCKTCEAAIAGLEGVDDITDKYNIEFVKLNNKKYARNLGIRQFPAVSFYKAGVMTVFDGDVLDTEAVVEFLTNEDALELPDKIESVDEENLFRILEEEDYVAVLFYEDKKRESMKALQHLEMIDDEADLFGIRFVRIIDLELADDYSLRTLPALAFFRHFTPILYIGDINNQEEVFEFLFQNKHTADEDFVIEDVDTEKLDILINHIDFVVVLFYKDGDEWSEKAISAVDSIDDNLKGRGVSVVKTSSPDQIQLYDIEILPKLIYFESEIPTFWPDDKLLDHNETILAWVEHCQDSDLIEEITEEMLEKLIANTDQIAVFFYGKKDLGSFESVLEGLENIDDELDSFELPFVKISSKTIASDFGFDELPAIVFFQRGVPALCDVDILDEGQVLKWILIEADLWVEPPLVEQIFIIENTRQEGFSSDTPELGSGEQEDQEEEEKNNLRVQL
ncbi:uncharacterized protein LOC111701796 [Eurytemora carolleeae]|uniref:uncharacterized protein LOC111701796 n=1 Tax=Eurytemora carolleeae TaxID=1294199 RepID=UPI000C784BFA|nr:uncharacterized protein LOC111701796 [Eurytemora carolleeae]|eukprot:XP_023328989.1 uncharacterized protein LOC111701796 [Eurytemora affinis]